MALITRLSRLFKADFHAVIDQLEEPDIVLRQAVREMQDVVTKGDTSLANLSQERERLEQAMTELSNSLKQTDEELDICFTSGKDELSKRLIKRKLENTNRLDRLRSNQLHLHQQSDELKNQQTGRKSILESMQQKVALLANEPHQVGPSSAPTDTVITEADIEIAFLKEQQKRALS